jgi:DNA-directed RNA polymerase specialized sigma24 family protein
VDAEVVPFGAFDAFYQDRWVPMVRLATLIVGRPDVAEELVQDAFVRTADAFGRVTQPNAYLRAAVVNACRNHLRRARLERRHEPGLPMPVHGVELDETWQQLQRLSPRRRAALVLRFYADMPVAEVARCLGCRPGTAASLIHRGLADLKEVLG